MRRDGESWQSIAGELGFSGPGAAYNAAAREVDPDYWNTRSGTCGGAFFSQGDGVDPPTVRISPSAAENSDGGGAGGGGGRPTAPCYACGRELPVDDFAPDSSKASGHSSICRRCDREKSRVYYQQNREAKKAKARERARRLRKEGR